MERSSLQSRTSHDLLVEGDEAARLGDILGIPVTEGANLSLTVELDRHRRVHAARVSVDSAEGLAAEVARLHA